MTRQDGKPVISHIALKVEDLDKSAAFYKDVFGFEETGRYRDGDHVSVHLTDGHLDLAMVKYDSPDSFMGQQAGPAPCIHHFGIDVDDIDAFKRTIEAHGGETFGDPTVPDAKVVKFRVPGAGGIAEVAAFGLHARTMSED